MRVRSSWQNGTQLVPAELNTIDEKLSNSVLGVNSAPTTYTPSSPIVVNGAGVVMGSPACEVQAGATLAVSSFSFVSNTPKHDGAGWTRTLRTPIGRTVGHTPSSWTSPSNNRFPHVGLGHVTPYVSATRLRVHHGARLTSVRLTYQCGVYPLSLSRALVQTDDTAYVYSTSGLPEPPFEISFGLVESMICVGVLSSERLALIRFAPAATTFAVGTIIDIDPLLYSFMYRPPSVDIIELDSNGDSAVLLSADVQSYNTTPFSRQTQLVGTVNQYVDARQNTYFARIVAGNYLQNVFESVELMFDGIADMRPQ